jgi:predicted acyl esterase
LARTRWTKFYLDAGTQRLTEQPPEQPASTDYAGLGDGVTFELGALDHDLEITGPLAAKLFAASETVDADFFLVLRVFDPAGDEVTFFGALDPNTPVAQGWLRASHRKLDPARSLPYRPWHPHDEKQALEPGRVYELDVEIWPTSIVVPAGYRLAFTVRGKDYEYRGEVSEFAKDFYYANAGVGPFTHADPMDRPADVFGGKVSLHTGGQQPSYLLLPIIDA